MTKDLMSGAEVPAAVGYQTFPSSASVTQLPTSWRVPSRSTTHIWQGVFTGRPATFAASCVPQPIDW
jgi:hypothetical protein